MTAAQQPLALADGVQLVEASAGTGKTYRITNLFALLVAERGLPVESILTGTFTRSATSELKDRIRRRLKEALSVLTGGEPGDDEFLGELVARRKAAQDGDEWEHRVRSALLDFDAAPSGEPAPV